MTPWYFYVVLWAQYVHTLQLNQSKERPSKARPRLLLFSAQSWTCSCHKHTYIVHISRPVWWAYAYVDKAVIFFSAWPQHVHFTVLFYILMLKVRKNVIFCSSYDLQLTPLSMRLPALRIENRILQQSSVTRTTDAWWLNLCSQNSYPNPKYIFL